MKRLPMILLPILLVVPSVVAQKGRAENSEGNELYENGLYKEALNKYQEALKDSPESPILRFNSGDAQYKIEAFDKAAEAFQEALSAEDLRLRAQALYNLGNVQYRKKDLQGAIESYKEALRLNPDDLDAKHNLEYVLRELKENPPPQSQQQDQNDQQQDQNDQQEQQNEQQQNQDAGSQDKEDQNRDSEQQQDQEQEKQEEQQNQQNQPQENQEESGEQQNQQPRPESDQAEKLPMTREQAAQILQALREDQKDLLRKRTIKSRPAAGGKDW